MFAIQWIWTWLISKCCYYGTQHFDIVGLILGLHPPNERRRYKVTPSLIGVVQT